MKKLIIAFLSVSMFISCSSEDNDIIDENYRKENNL